MHQWMRQRKRWPQVKAPTMETAPDSVRCGKWDLRATKIRRNRGPNIGSDMEYTNEGNLGAYQHHHTVIRNKGVRTTNNTVTDLLFFSGTAISAQDRSSTKKQLTTCTRKRKLHASPTSSANSVVGENNVQAPKMDRTQIVFDKWTYATTQIFIEVMLEEAKKEEATNSKKTRTFNPHQWVAICSEFGKRTNTMGYSVQKLKEKFSRLKHDLTVFKDLKDNTGFGWDPVKQTVTAPEPVWQEYLQGHKDAKQFKSKGLDHYDILVELCEGTLATGAFAGYPSTLGGPTAEAEREMMRQGKSIRMADQMSMDSRGKRKSDGTGGSSSKSIKIDERSQAYTTFGYAQQKKGEYFEKLTADQFSVTDCINALDEIASRVDDEQYYKAYDKLAFGPPTGRQGFMGLSTDRRIGWVERLK